MKSKPRWMIEVIKTAKAEVEAQPATVLKFIRPSSDKDDTGACA